MVLGILVVLAAPLSLAAGESDKDLEKMQGTWTVVAMESKGRKVPSDDLKKSELRLSIQDDNFAYQASKKILREGTIRIDPEQKPKTLDSSETGPGGQAQATVGIYEIDGDTLRVCFAPAGEQRPKKFTTGPKSPASIVVYQRVKP